MSGRHIERDKTMLSTMYSEDVKNARGPIAARWARRSTRSMPCGKGSDE
jgi:hypothetical protein